MTDHLRNRIATAIRNTPARYPDDIATAVLAALLTGAEREPRIPLDHLTSNQLDRLYDDLDRYADILSEMNTRAIRLERRATRAEAEAARYTETDSADAAAGSYAHRAERAENAIAAVAGLRDDLRGITGARWIADALDNILDQTAPTPAQVAPSRWLLAGTRDLDHHRYTAAPVTPEMERAATARARQAAADSERAAEYLAKLSQSALDGTAQSKVRLHCPRCGDDITDYAADDHVYRTGDDRPYCSGECVVAAHRARVERSDIGSEFIQQADSPDQAGVSAFEESLARKPSPKAPSNRAEAAAVASVRAMHQQYRFAGDDTKDYCAHCNQISGGWIPWPCPTIQALDQAAPAPAEATDTPNEQP
ncbi:hypothetical protein [Streptomyces antibioticus]|uniref:hypothetical protein n=1 Tax=Streptomyces antibioticus TaxID=1890 RepID=UPI0036FF27B1